MMVKKLQDTTTLHNGVKMPWFGLGVFKVEEGPELVNAVKTAIKHGYRSVDTAAIYENEAGVGKGIQEGLREADISREELFVTDVRCNIHRLFFSKRTCFMFANWSLWHILLNITSCCSNSSHPSTNIV